MSELTLEAPAPQLQQSRFRGRFTTLRQLWRRPAGMVSILIIVGILVTALLAPVLAPYDPTDIDVLNLLAGPSSEHWLGTDYLGRDMLSRVLYGARTAMLIAIPAVIIGFPPGLLLGLVGGYFGGTFDKVTIVIVDSILSLPAVILALVVLTLFGNSPAIVTVLIAIALVPGYARLARAQTLAAKQNPYVKSERALGASNSRIIVRHITPNILPPLLVLMAIDIPGAIGIEAGLAFLGLGVQPPTADWGVMLNEGFLYVRSSVWGLVGPLIALLLVTGAFTVLGETLRDITDPRLSGTRFQRRRVDRKAPTT